MMSPNITIPWGQVLLFNYVDMEIKSSLKRGKKKSQGQQVAAGVVTSKD